MMYTRLLSLFVTLLLTISSVNAVGVLLLDGIESGVDGVTPGGGRLAGNVQFSYLERDYSPETVVIISIYESNGRFVKEVTLTPSISPQTYTNLSNGKYIIKSYNIVSGDTKTIPFLVHS